MGIELATFRALAVRRAGEVLHVTLNRPEARNAMSMTMVHELRAVVAQCELSGQTRVIVLRGAGGHFCAGADLKDMTSARMRMSENPSALIEINAAFGELCVAYADTPLVLVAVLEGAVMGAGFGLACVADVVLADDTVRFRLPETSLGVVPAQIAPFLVQRLGHSDARRLAVTGASISAREALALRLVHEVHPAGTLDAALVRALHVILKNAPNAVAATKALMARARLAPPATLVQDAAEVFSRSALSAEGIEGTNAFLQKRKASWAPD